MTPVLLMCVYMCVYVYFRSRSFASENVRIKWDYKDTCSLLDYKVVLLLSDGNKEIFKSANNLLLYCPF